MADFLYHSLPETPAARALRISQEAEAIAQAHTDIDSGLGIEDEAMEAWLDRLDHDADAALPSMGPFAAR